MKLVTSIALLLLLVLLVCMFRSRSSEPEVGTPTGPPSVAAEARSPLASEPDEHESRVDAGLASEPTSSRPPAADGALSSSLEIRSAAGVPIEQVELELPERTWSWHPLQDGRCAIDPGHVPLRVRAPGHREARVEAPREPIVLEPDALLTLEADHLAQCLVVIETMRALTRGREDTPGGIEIRREIDRHLSYGFVDAGQWALAASPRTLERFFFGTGEVQVELVWRDRHFAYLTFVPKDGLRATWKVPCEGLAAVAPLDVVVERASGSAEGEVEFRIGFSTDPFPRRFERTDWGSVQIEGFEFLERRRIATGPLRFEDMPLGLAYCLIARDLDSGAIGLANFVHDRSEQRIRLADSIVVRGHLVPPVGFAAPKEVRFEWKQPGPINGDWYRSNWKRLAIPENGTFELRGWENPPHRPDTDLAPPSRIELIADAPGFEPIHKELEVDTLGRCEAGELELAPRAAQFHLLAGHGISVMRGDEEWNLQLAGAPRAWWTVDGGRPAADGALDVLLARVEGDRPDPPEFDVWEEGSSTRKGRALPEKPAPALLLGEHGEHGHAFELAPGGYARVAERQVRLEVDMRAGPGPRQRWRLRWRWRGMAQSIGLLGGEALDEVRDFEFLAPKEGVTVEWFPAKPDGSALAEVLGTIELVSDQARIEIR